MKYSKKKAAGQISKLLGDMVSAPRSERIAVPWFEIDEIVESLKDKRDWESGVKLGLLHYMQHHHKDEAIFLPKTVLAFLNGNV